MAADATGAAARLPTVEVCTLRGHRAPLQFARFTSNGRYAITGGQDKTIRLWNPYRDGDTDSLADASRRSSGGCSGLLLKEYVGHGYEVLEAVVSSGNDRIASVGGDKCAIVWDVATAAPVRKLFGHEQRINSCAFNEDASVLVTASNDKTCRCFDVRSASRSAFQVLSGFRDNVTRVLATPTEIAATSMDGHLRVFDLRVGRLLDDAVGSPLVCMARSYDGNCTLASTFVGGGELLLLERASGAALRRYAGHGNALYRCAPAFTSDDAHVVCGGEDGRVVFWDLVAAAAGAPARTLPRAHSRVVSWVETHPDPAVCAMLTASYDGTAKLWLHPEQDVRALTLAPREAV